MSRPVLVLDFDGTVCLGDDPIRLYAKEIVALAPGHRETILPALDEFLTGTRDFPGAEDGYQAVASLARAAHLDADAMSRAYLASRTRIAAGEGEMYPPEGFADFLDQLQDAGVHTVLLTNAPATGAYAWLEAQHLLPLLNQVITDAGKPERMPTHLRTLLADHDLLGTPHLLASVGDVWINDVAPAIDLGARGFYIDRFNLNVGSSTARGRGFPDLYTAITDWAIAVTEP